MTPAGKVAACPACRSTRSRRGPRIREHAFRRCRDCGSLYLERPPAAPEVAPLYRAEAYFTNPDFGSPEAGGYHGYRDYLADRAEHVAKFGRILANLEQLRSPGDLLDVGAGPGFLLAVARERGWRALGLDPNPWAGQWAAAHLDVEVRATGLDEAELPDRAFDAVTLLDVLEHVAEPERLLLEAARVVRPEGALAIVTPDAGSAVSRALGRRWPELQRVPEHLVLFSVRGLAALLPTAGWEPVRWHSIGKTSTLATLAADALPIAPAAGRTLQRGLSGRAVAERVFEIDPRTKLCLYARRVEGAPEAGDPRRRPPRVARRAVSPATPREAVLDDLELLAGARRYCDWLFAQYAGAVRGRVAEMGAGIGTFSRRILNAGAAELLALEPEPASAGALERRLGGDPRVTVAREALPAAPSLRAGGFDLVVCQNVLEHVPDDEAAMSAMASALAPGAELWVLVPARPGLYGRLDAAYGHERRYDRDRLQRLTAQAGLQVVDLYGFNLLGMPGWWVSGRLPGGGRIGRRSLAAYEALVPAWRRLEGRWRPRSGLSLVLRARRPD